MDDVSAALAGSGRRSVPAADQLPASVALARAPQTYTCRYSGHRYDFFMCLRADLTRLGLGAKVRVHGAKLEFELGPVALDPATIIQVMREESTRRLAAERQFLRRMADVGVGKHFIDGNEVDVSSIRPSIMFCESRANNDLFKFCRLQQSVPSPQLLYRQVRAIVRDEGQPGSPVMGAFGLSSAVYSLSCRDKLLGWKKSERARAAGLRSSMQLSLCIAVPPYNHLRAGKLLAALAASNMVAREFSRKYARSRLKSIVTTSANGLHSPIYSRIMVRPGGLYRRIGETTGYSALAFSKETLAAARAVVVDSDGGYSDNRTISTLKRAMNLCGLPRERMIRLGIRKGVYLALAGSGGWPAEHDVLRYWSSNVLRKAAARMDILQKVLHTRSGDHLIRLLTESVKP